MTYKINGKVVSEQEWLSHGSGKFHEFTQNRNPRDKKIRGSGWPWTTTFGGTTRSGVHGLRNFLAQNKCDAKVNDDGSVSCDNRQVRNHYFRVRNWFDQNAGCGDPTPTRF